MTTRKNQPVELGDLPFEHWHVLGPILWGVVAYLAAGVLHLLGDAVPALYVTLVGLAVSLLAPLTAIYKRFTFLLMLATTGLLSWTTATTPWARWPALSALAGSILFGLGYQALRTHESKAVDNDVLAQKAASKGRYVDLLESVGLKGLKEHKRIPFPAGKTIQLLLPASGKVFLRRLKESVTALEIAAARGGLHVRFDFEQNPESAALVDMHVFERDVLAEEIPLEPDRGPKSILDPLPLGKYATGEICFVTFREVAALMVGLKGKGKSGLINTHLAYLTGCTDAIVWMMDGKGGETVRPWLQPFLDMVTKRPAINWAAADDAEYDAMLLAANFVREFRTSAAFRPLGGFPSAAAPSVIVIVEEASVITGLGRYGNGVQRQKLAQDGVTLGRSSCVDWVFATQRAVLDMLGTGAMKSNLDLRYGMGIQEQADARMVFPDGAMAEAMFRLGKENRYRGTFLMQSPNESRVMPAKGFWVDPSTIPGLAQTNAQWTAELDKPTADYVHAKLVALGVPGGYHDRWDRWMGRVPASQSAVSSHPAVPPSQDAPSRPTETTGTPGQYDGSRGRDAVRDAVAASRAKREAETFEQLWTANFETVEVGDETHLRDVSSAPDNAPPILKCMLAVFKGRGNPEFLPSRTLCEELPGEPKMTTTALGKLMALCSVSPGEGVWEGKRARGYTRDALETSVKRGSWTLGAADWRP